MRSITIVELLVKDIRFPTSETLAGSDAVHSSPDYSCCYVSLITTVPELTGNGLTFTLGRGNEVVLETIRSLAFLVRNATLRDILADFSGFSRRLTSEGQLRWLGPEKGVIHMACGAIINAVWDLYAKSENKPVWKLLCDLSGEALVKMIDFRWIGDALTEADVKALIDKNFASRDTRLAEVQSAGIPAYTTKAGWIGFSDSELRRLCAEALAEGWTGFKVKVGNDLEEDIRRLRIVREEIGDVCKLMIDANQRWSVSEAIEWVTALAEFDITWIEEPTCADDVLGHQKIREALKPYGIGVATGEVCSNRVMFKQFFQAGAFDYCQIDSCRVAGVNENIAILFMAGKFGVPVCPHGGGVGLSQMIQHLSLFNYVCVSPIDAVTEYASGLHHHFEDPLVMKNGAYMPPMSAGFSTTLKEESIRDYEFPNGREWKKRLAVIDTHMHVIDQSRMTYPWLKACPSVDRDWTIEDYNSAMAEIRVEKCVFVEVNCLPEQSLSELDWVSQVPGRIAAAVIYAPVHLGKKAVENIVQEARRSKGLKVVGVRWQLQVISDLSVCFSKDFLSGLQALSQLGLHFEICALSEQLPKVLELVRVCPEVSFILEHIGGVVVDGGRDRNSEWVRDIKALASFSNVYCKLSGVTTFMRERRVKQWTELEVVYYLREAIRAFGVERVMYGSDWFVSEISTKSQIRWFSAVKRALQEEFRGNKLVEIERKVFYHNAAKLYNL